MKRPAFCQYACVDKGEPGCPLPGKLDGFFEFLGKSLDGYVTVINTKGVETSDPIDTAFKVAMCIAAHRSTPQPIPLELPA